jgi:hypothetical protein
MLLDCNIRESMGRRHWLSTQLGQFSDWCVRDGLLPLLWGGDVDETYSLETTPPRLSPSMT